MPPYSAIACCVRDGDSVGVALSDVYLSGVIDLQLVRCVNSARALVDALRADNVGALVLGLPCAHDSMKETAQYQLANFLHRGPSASMPCCFWCRRAPLEDLVHLAVAEDWLANSRSRSTQPSHVEVEAAMTLQEMLNEEVGAWRNTFG